MRAVIERILTEADPGGDRGEALVAADWCLRHGERALAASMLDRAYGLDPDDAEVAARRAQLLDALAVVEHGLCWRYVPAGAFLMGSEHGDADERPVHRVELDAFWIMDAPITWAAYARLLGWQGLTPDAPSADDGEHLQRFWLLAKICHQYCETETEEAQDWHAHALAGGSSADLFGTPQRGDPDAPYTYDHKPLVAVGPAHAEHLAEHLSGGDTLFELPSEARWEKAARGGRIGARYPWGDAPPTPERCDFDHFGAFHLAPTRSLPPNGYGLFGCSGGVWEWTRDPYDALAYRNGCAAPNPDGAHVLRGGSFTDPAPAVTVSYRMSRRPDRHAAPNLGFRLCRFVV